MKFFGKERGKALCTKGKREFSLLIEIRNNIANKPNYNQLPLFISYLLKRIVRLVLRNHYFTYILPKRHLLKKVFQLHTMRRLLWAFK